MNIPEEFYVVYFDLGDGDGAMQFETNMLRNVPDVRDHIMEVTSTWPDAEYTVFLVEDRRLVDVTELYLTYRTTIVTPMGTTHCREWLEANEDA